MEPQFPNKNFKLVYVLSFSFFFVGLWMVFYLAHINFKEESFHFSKIKLFEFQISWDVFRSYFKSRVHHPIVQLVLQLIIILGFSRFLTILFRKVGQPGVIGEMFAGILLGPSGLGLLAPSLFYFIFPSQSLENLHTLSLFGLITFMFVLGMEFDIGIFESKIRSAILISHVNILFPFLLGIILAYFLYKDFSSPSSNFLSFSLFMGVSLSITAFPVLARIVQEKKIMKTQLGIISIICAAINDFTAWIILAVVISITNSQGILSALLSFISVVLYILFMLKILQPFLMRFSKIYITQEVIGRGVLSFLALILLSSAFITEIFGIHAVFGAFLAGIIMPNTGELRKVLSEKIEDFSSIFLLPLFFAYTGLRTQIDLLYNWDLLGITILIIFLASFGKIVSGMLAAKYTGMNWKESFGLGILMNTRGLVELVILNISYDLGILSPQIFTMMVIMALVTTITTGPIIKLLFPDLHKQKTNKLEEKQNNKILISFGPPHSGEILFNLATQIFGNQFHYNALHVTPFPESLTIDRFNDIKKIHLEGIQKISNQKKIPVRTIFRMTNQITEEITSVIEEENPEFVLIGGAQSIFLDNALGGKVESILANSNTNIGIFLDKNFSEIKSTLVFFKYKIETEILFFVASQIQKNKHSEINIIYKKEHEPDEAQLRKFFSKSAKFTEYSEIERLNVEKYSLAIIGYNHWLDIYNNEEEIKLFLKQEKEVNKNLSILILRARE